MSQLEITDQLLQRAHHSLRGNAEAVRNSVESACYLCQETFTQKELEFCEDVDLARPNQLITDYSAACPTCQAFSIVPGTVGFPFVGSALDRLSEYIQTVQESAGLAAYWNQAFENKVVISTSNRCGCVNCLTLFSSEEIEDWGHAPMVFGLSPSAVCPYCRHPYVIGDASGLLLTRQTLWRCRYEYMPYQHPRPAPVDN